MRLFLCGVFILIFESASAQYSENLISDRPGQSISPNTVGKNIVQFQAGYSYDKLEQTYLPLTFDFPGPITSKRTNHNGNLKVRYGITERFESSFQATFGEEKTTYSNLESIESKAGFQLLGIAVRGNLFNSENGNFSLGSEVEVQFAPNEDNDMDYSNVLVTISGGLGLTDKLSATANMGLLIQKWSELFFTANLSYQASDNFGVFAEYYPVLGDNNGTTLLRSYANAGAYYSLSPNFMLDLAGSFLVSDYRRDENSEVSQYIVQCGLTYRFIKFR